MKTKLAILNTHPIQYFAPLYKRLAQEERIELTVLYCSRWGANEYVDPQFNTVFKWDIPLLEGYNYKFLKNLRKTENVNKFFNLINIEVISDLIKNRYDFLLIHGHNNLTNIIAVITAKIIGIKLLMRADTQLYVKKSKIKKIFRKTLLRLFYKLFDGFLYIGTRNREFYNYIGVPENKLFFVPYAVNNDFFISKVENARKNISEIKKKFNLNNNNINILYASKLITSKKPIDLLKAYEIVKREFENINLIFVGTGEEEDNLKNYVKKNRLKDVFFLGFLNQSVLPKILAVSDIFVLPAINEQWGLIINEAMCAGQPIIVANEVGAVPDLLKEGINGYSFEAGNINQLAEKLLLISKNDNLRISMMRKSLEIISKWSYTEDIMGIKQALKII